MKLNSKRIRDVHERATLRFEQIYSAVQDEREQALSDRRFYSVAGAQWEGDLEEQFANKPMFEMNKVHLAVMRIINEYRNNRITVDFTSKDGADNDKLADACDGMYRADEQDSGAQEAYDNAFEEAVAGGFGAWRLRTRYEDEDDEDDTRQRVCIEPIYDADSCVFFDLDCKRQDKRNAKFAYVLHGMTREAYEDEYGDEDINDWNRSTNQSRFDWVSADLIYVAEYYEVEEKTEVTHVFRGMALGDDEPDEIKVTAKELLDDPDKRATLEAKGFREVRQKRMIRKKVHKYILNGNKVLEDCGIIAGSRIPIVPVYGKRWFVDGIERFMGHVRLSKDAQRLKNMLISRLAEISSKSPVSKPIFHPEQMLGHTQMWASDNVEDWAYLLINPMFNEDGVMIPAGPIGYTKAPEIPQAMAALMGVTDADLQDLLGNQQAGEELQPNMSGKAVELVQNKLDMQTFIYMDNMRKSVQTGGEIWLSMAKDVFVEDDRQMKTVSKDGSVGSVNLFTNGYDEDTGAVTPDFDMSRAKFDVVSEVGPSSSSKRAATVRAVTGLMQMSQDPETNQILMSMALRNIEGEGMGDIREYARKKLVQLGVEQPTDEDQKAAEQAAANQKPNAQDQYLLAAAQAQQANAAKAQADIGLTQAKQEESKANALDKLAGISMAERQDLVNNLVLLNTMQNPPALPAGASGEPVAQEGQNVTPPAQ